MKNQPYVTQVESLSSKPVEVRQSTDRLFILLFPINLLLWIALGIDYMIPYISYFPKSFILWGVLAGWQVVAAFVAIFLAFISNKLRMTMVTFIKFFIAVVILVIVYLIYWELCRLVEITNYLSTLKETEFIVMLLIFLIVSIIWLMYLILIFIRMKDVEKTLLTQVINEPNRAILGSLSTLLFSIPIVTLSTIIFTFNVNMIYDHLFGNPFSDINSWVWLHLFTFLFVGTYVLNFVYNFGFMVMGDFFTHYYNTPGHQKGSYVFQSITRIFRYHLGTVSFLSIPILPSICALVVAFKNNPQLGRQSGFLITNFFSKACLVMDISEYALMQTSINGHQTLKSIKEMFDLRHSNSLIFLIGNAVSFKLTEMTTVFAAVITVIVEELIFYRNLSWSDTDFDYAIGYLIRSVIWPMVFLNLMSKFLIRPAMCIFSIYKMANLRESAEMEESSHLKDILNV